MFDSQFRDYFTAANSTEITLITLSTQAELKKLLIIAISHVCRAIKLSNHENGIRLEHRWADKALEQLSILTHRFLRTSYAYRYFSLRFKELTLVSSLLTTL